MRYESIAERFWAKVNKNGPMPPERPDLGNCWIWTAAVSGGSNGGYGQFWLNGKQVPAHRFAYQQQVGPIPDGHQPDHLCRVRNCMRGAHMEAVSAKVNLLRGNSPTGLSSRQTACKRGHDFTAENTIRSGDGHRHCRECTNAWKRAKRRGDDFV